MAVSLHGVRRVRLIGAGSDSAGMKKIMNAQPRTFPATLASIAVASCLASLSFAQDDRRPITSSDRHNVAMSPMPAVDLTQGVFISSLDADKFGLRRYDGQKLLNTEGAELGTIKDFIVHPASSRVRYVVVSSGGVRGMGNSLRLVPIEAVRHGSRDTRLEVDIMQSAWLQVPPVSDEHYVIDRFDISAAQHQIMLQSYGANRAGAVANSTVPVGSPGEITGLLRASALNRKDVRAGTATVGQIENIIFDVERATAAALIDSSGEFTGTRGKFIVPLSRLTYEKRGQNPIGTTLTRADFDRAATFATTAPTQVRSPDDRPLTPTGRVENR